MSEAALLGIDVRELRKELFSSRQHASMMVDHNLNVEKFYGHGESPLLSNLDVVLAAQQARLDWGRERERRRLSKAHKPRNRLQHIFEPTERQLAIAIEALGKDAA